jgi:uncharacterized membrane protein YuzA (DUF378 family)
VADTRTNDFHHLREPSFWMKCIAWLLVGVVSAAAVAAATGLSFDSAYRVVVAVIFGSAGVIWLWRNRTDLF